MKESGKQKENWDIGRGDLGREKEKEKEFEKLTGFWQRKFWEIDRDFGKREREGKRIWKIEVVWEERRKKAKGKFWENLTGNYWEKANKSKFRIILVWEFTEKLWELEKKRSFFGMWLDIL